MNQIPLYQHPFVDVFKVFKIAEWKQCSREGDVRFQFDKDLAKNVIKINGSTLASNFVQIPSKMIKSLGLTGKWCYVFMKAIRGKQFSFHIDFKVDQSFICRISFSNHFSQSKIVNSTNIQIPLKPEHSRWNVIAINSRALISQYFPTAPCTSIILRSIQICANCQLRGIFTSDIQYRAATLPKQMQMRLKKGEQWFEAYDWIQKPKNVSEDNKNPTTNPQPIIKPKQSTAAANFVKSKKKKQLGNKQNKNVNGIKQDKFHHYDVEEIKQTPQAVFREEQFKETYKKQQPSPNVIGQQGDLKTLTIKRPQEVKQINR